MSDTRRLFLKKTASAAGGVLAATCLSPSAFAFDCKSEQRRIVFENGQATTPDWKLGNCELGGASFHFKDGSPGKLLFDFTSSVRTSFTHTKDVWHLHIVLVAINLDHEMAPVTLFDHTFDGPQMSEKDNPAWHRWNETTSIDVGNLKFKARIEGQLTSCC